MYAKNAQAAFRSQSGPGESWELCVWFWFAKAFEWVEETISGSKSKVLEEHQVKGNPGNAK